MLRRHNFNLIEIIIAMGIILVGVCSLMVIFPIGANASRDAAVQIESANVAEQFLNYVKFVVDDGGAATLNTKIGTTEPSGESDFSSPNGEWERVEKMNGIDLPLFRDKNNVGVYQLVFVRDDTGTKKSSTVAVNDASIEKRVIIRATYEDSTGNLTIEASWPAEAAYEVRNKEKYVLDLKP